MTSYTTLSIAALPHVGVDWYVGVLLALVLIVHSVRLAVRTLGWAGASGLYAATIPALWIVHAGVSLYPGVGMAVCVASVTAMFALAVVSLYYSGHELFGDRAS